MIGMALMPVSLEAQVRQAPTIPILIVDSERLYSESAFGLRVQTEQDAEVAVLAAEYRRIEAELAEEERDLTDKRPTMSPEDFRAVADAFDARVESIRDVQQRRENDIATRSAAERERFFIEVQSLFAAVLRDTGAQMMIEKRFVYVHNSSLDVTDAMIERANQLLGDGSAQSEEQ